MTTLPRIFDRKRRLAVRDRANSLSERTGSARFILDDMVEDICERLDFMQLEAKRVLLIGDRGGVLQRQLPIAPQQIESMDAGTLDEEQPLPLSGMDLIVSLSSLDTVNDLPGALIHLRNALAPGGLMIASFVAAGSLPRLRQALLAADGDRPAARLHPMVDNRAGAELMQRCGFNRQVVDSRSLDVRYRSFDQLIADLRAQALTNVLCSQPPIMSRHALHAARQAFMTQADGDGRVTERFEILALTGWKT